MSAAIHLFIQTLVAIDQLANALLLGLDKPWHTSPGDLWEWAVQQPGARVVPEDELRTPWSAHT